jgi:beta-1,2-mannobiose phosphorylase / 1,2-beta-oligomannan phosphorylase
MAKVLKKTKKVIKKKISPKKKVVKSKKVRKIKKKIIGKKLSSTLERFVGNPVIYPAGNTYWESKATFNPTAFLHDGKVHVIYRAVGVNDMSTLGYAKSDDGYYLSGRTFKPIFIHRNYPVNKGEPIFYSSGGGWNGGAEDPRVTKIDDMLYLTYTAFDGWGSVRIGLTSISLEDFLNKKWNWKKPVLISPPGEVHKNWVIFPERIKGKYAILHSLSPEIMIEYVRDLNSFDGTKFIKSIHQGHPKWQLRPKGMRGVGGAPIETKYGWLVFYHAMETDEMHRYKLWAMILDLKDPTKVLYRSKKPILEPDAFYENEGLKSGIVYSCGAVVKGEDLFIYYGGADMVSCVATANFKLFLKELISTGITKLKKERKEN